MFDISFGIFVLLRLLMLQSCPLLDPFISSFRFLWSDPVSMLWVFWTYLKAWGFYMESQVIWGSFVKEVSSQVLAVKTSRKPSTVETLRFHAMIPLFFFAERFQQICWQVPYNWHHWDEVKCLKFPSHGILWYLGVGDMKILQVLSQELSKFVCCPHPPP